VLKCALHPKIAKNSPKTPFLGGGSKTSGSFKVIDVDKSKKPEPEQHVCTYSVSATVFTLYEPIMAK